MIGNINTLPKWAREEIMDLRRKLKDARDELAEVTSDTGKIHWETFDPNQPRVPHFVPENATVHFNGADGEVCVHMDMNGKVSIRSEIGGLIVLPSASNMIHVGSDRGKTK